MITEQIVYAFSWLSWSSIIAGAVAAMAVSIIMAMLGVALGFTAVHHKLEDPAASVGKSFGVWSFVSVLVSLIVGGFIAGLFAGQRGMEHGFMVWALVTIALICFSRMAIGCAMRAIGAAMRNIGSGAMDMASTVGKGAVNAASNAASTAVNELRESINLNFDSDAFTDNVKSVLRDTGVDTLQPEYLQQQMREARSDLRSALHQLSMKPGTAEKVISDFLAKEKSRLDALAGSVDKEDAINALMRTRNLPREEAETLVNDAMSIYNQAVCKAQEAIYEAKAQVRDAKEYISEMAEEAREKAEKWSSTAAKAATTAAVALILAALISMGAGWCGARYATSWYPLHNTYYIR